MQALALTDYNGVFGAVRFTKAARAAGIKPIIGTEVAFPGVGKVVLLARSATGYRNLNRILTESLTGYAVSPSASVDILLTSNKDLYVLLTPAEWKSARDSFKKNVFQQIDTLLAALSRDQLIIELQNHGLPGDSDRLGLLWNIARSRGLLAVASNNVHLLGPEDYGVHKSLVAAAQVVHHRKAIPRENMEFYFKSETEMASRFRGYEEALVNTELIAKECTFDLFSQSAQLRQHSPQSLALLRDRCAKRLLELYPGIREEAFQRLFHELSVIEEKGFSEYFLEVADIVDFARSQNIRHSCRGSAPGSLVVYLLGISTVDPLQNGLLFERFLNPERPDIPDIDIDFDSDRRDEVTRYAVEKHRGHAALVATVSRFRARSAVREIGRSMGMSYEKLSEFTQSFGFYLPASMIREAIHVYPELRSSELGTEQYKDLLDTCSRIDGFPRHLSVHLGGLVITKDPVTTLSPIQGSSKGIPVLSFDKDDIETLGLIKTDLLGLRMLAAIEQASGLLEDEKKHVDLENLDTTDPSVYEFLRTANTMGCFQVESPGMRGLLGQLCPEKLPDIVSAISLFRPGPVQADMVTPYIARKRGKEEWDYLHPCLQPILEETFGVVLFQEQAIRIGREIAGFSYGKADLMRRAMVDPESAEMKKLKEEFLSGALQKGIDTHTANEIFSQLSTLAAFGFNKAHAASFARIVFQSVYLKLYHTAEFMVGVLNSLPGMYPERVLLHEARRMGVPILGPDINKSNGTYTTEDGSIRVGLRRIRNLGPSGLSSVLSERTRAPFENFEDFERRVRLHPKVLQSMILAGVFDSFCPSRKSLLLSNREPGVCDKDEDYSIEEKVAYELDNIGLDLSAHVMSTFRGSLDRLGVLRSIDLKGQKNGEWAAVAGIKVVLHTPPTRSGIRVIFITLEDETGVSDAAIFPAVQERFGSTIFTADALVVAGTVRKQGTSVSIVANRIMNLRDALQNASVRPFKKAS